MSERLVDAAIARWLDLRAAGQAPSIDDFLRDYPTIADELRGLLETMQQLDDHGSGTPAARTVWMEGRAFEVLGPLGLGGMGEVHLASERGNAHLFAVKLLPAAFARDTERRARIEREAVVGSILDHPNIVRVHGRGDWDGTPCVVMDFIAGIDLAEVLGHLRRLPPGDLARCQLRPLLRQALATSPAAVGDAEPAPAADHDDADDADYFGDVARIVADLAAALQHAHEHRVLHRDVKPRNIVLDAELRPHLVDFGLARSLEDTAMSQPGDQIGTFHYMSPEMVQHGATKVDHRTDIYSLGVTLYELLTLSLPFTGKSSPALIRSIASDPAPWPRRRNPRVPESLQRIVLKAMHKRPERRYPTAAAMAADLHCYLDGQAVTAPRPNPLGPWLAGVHRHRAALGIAAGVLVVGALLATSTMFAAEPGSTRRVEIAGVDGDWQLLGIRGPFCTAPVLQSGSAHGTLGQQLPLGTYVVSVRGGTGLPVECTLEVAPPDEEHQAQMLPVQMARPAPVEGMVRVAAGTYPVGPIELLPTSIPEQMVTVRAFWIDVHEVSNAEFAEYCRDHPTAAPGYFVDGKPPADLLDHPVVMVSWETACAYAAWRGKRLPLDVEWEIAARGGKEDWGVALMQGKHDVRVGLDRPSSGRGDAIATLLRLTAPVRTAGEDIGPFGTKHMLGNVREWVLDRYWVPPDSPMAKYSRHRATRGHWAGDRPNQASLRLRSWSMTGGASIGFRCALSDR